MSSPPGPTTTSPSDLAGFVYLIVNPRFPGWVKVGQTKNVEARLRQYNTGDPWRAYRVLVAVPTVNRRHAEWLAHTRLKRLGYDRRSEWFDCAPAVAERVINKAVAMVEEGSPPG